MGADVSGIEVSRIRSVDVSRMQVANVLSTDGCANCTAIWAKTKLGHSQVRATLCRQSNVAHLNLGLGFTNSINVKGQKET